MLSEITKVEIGDCEGEHQKLLSEPFYRRCVAATLSRHSGQKVMFLLSMLKLVILLNANW